MKKNSKFLSFIITLCLVAPLLTVPVWAAEEEGDPEGFAMTVNVRVESVAEDAEETLLSRVPVMFNAEEIEEKAPTVLDALHKAVLGEYTLEESEFGAFITSILDVSDDSGRYSWMFTVNNTTPWVSADACEIFDRDEIVFYFIDWQETSYAYFNRTFMVVEAGEEFSLTLMSLDFNGDVFPVDGAQILIRSDMPLPRIQHNTDELGQVSLSFAHAGGYVLSARKGDGVSVISRPLCEVLVVEPGDPARLAFEEGTASVNVDFIEINLDDILSQIDMESLISGAMHPPVTYYIDTGELFILGHYIILPEDQQPVLDDAYEELYLPLRALTDIMGMDVVWNAEEAVVSIIATDGVLYYVYDFSVHDVLFDIPFKIIRDRLYVPSVFLIEIILAEFFM
jgi:hypothetical protein